LRVPHLLLCFLDEYCTRNAGEYESGADRDIAVSLSGEPAQLNGHTGLGRYVDSKIMFATPLSRLILSSIAILRLSSAWRVKDWLRPNEIRGFPPELRINYVLNVAKELENRDTILAHGLQYKVWWLYC
jgi:hypothetical protein